MATDERDILELLRDELDFIEKGGYGRSVRTPWQSKSTFQDSLSCINYGYPYRAHPCNECHLLNFVSPEHRTEEVPCHFIPLNTDGETVEDLELQDNQAKIEREVSKWLRARIKEIEEDRTSQRMPNQRAAASISMAISEPAAVSMFNSFRRLQAVACWVRSSSISLILARSHWLTSRSIFD